MGRYQKMKILKPNIDNEETIYIVKDHVFVLITDYNLKMLLKEIIISPGKHTWQWVILKEGAFIDISDITDKVCSFDNAINMKVNNLYCTVYDFKSYDEMMDNRKAIKYIDSITTVYKEKL